MKMVWYISNNDPFWGAPSHFGGFNWQGNILVGINEMQTVSIIDFKEFGSFEDRKESSSLFYKL